MYNDFLNKLKIKYNYDNDLMKAIEISIPIMVDTYGEDSIESILTLFNSVRIFATSDMSKKNRDSIEHEMIGSINSNIVSEDNNPYGNDYDPGAYYSYEPIFDSNMNVTGEIRWIVADKINKYREDGYRRLFGTNINMPYFLHELNHAFAMQNAVYKTEGNIVTAKHGMYITKREFKRLENGNIELKDAEESDIILEEMINEMYTQIQLTKLFEKNNYDEVRDILRSINHVPAGYGPILITFASIFEKLISKEKLYDYRINNDVSIKEEFNTLAMQSEIYKKYMQGKEPWKYFSEMCYEMFILSSNGFKMDRDDYTKRQRELMAEAFTPIASFRDKKLGTMDLEKYEGVREDTLHQSEEAKKM